jgi:hypothetical protein
LFSSSEKSDWYIWYEINTAETVKAAPKKEQANRGEAKCIIHYIYRTAETCF